jgi:hypothetical protein
MLEGTFIVIALLTRVSADRVCRVRGVGKMGLLRSDGRLRESTGRGLSGVLVRVRGSRSKVQVLRHHCTSAENTADLVIRRWRGRDRRGALVGQPVPKRHAD